MTKPLDTNSQGYTNVLLEDINHKFAAVLEVTQPIPGMQRTINATFEEVGKLRIDADAPKRTAGEIKDEIKEINSRLGVLEKAHHLLGRNTEEIDELKTRVAALESALNAR